MEDNYTDAKVSILGYTQFSHAIFLRAYSSHSDSAWLALNMQVKTECGDWVTPLFGYIFRYHFTISYIYSSYQKKVFLQRLINVTFCYALKHLIGKNNVNS